jgi:hypothetical protein
MAKLSPGSDQIATLNVEGWAREFALSRRGAAWLKLEDPR